MAAAIQSVSTLARFTINYNNSIATGISSPYLVDLPAGGTQTAWSVGSGAGAVNLSYTEYTTLSSTSVTRDLTALAASSTNTGAAAFSAVKGWLIRVDAASTGNLVVGNAASVQAPINGVGGTTETISIPPGGNYFLENPSAAGWVVSTNKNLKLNCAAANATYSLSIIGIS